MCLHSPLHKRKPGSGLACRDAPDQHKTPFCLAKDMPRYCIWFRRSQMFTTSINCSGKCFHNSVKLWTYPVSPCSKGWAEDWLDTHFGKAEVRVEVMLAVWGILWMFLQSAMLMSCLHMPETQQLWDSWTVWDSCAHTQQPHLLGGVCI